MPTSILTRLRRNFGFREREVAMAGGWSPKAFSELERNDDPDFEDGMKLAELYGVDLFSILEDGKIHRKDIPIAALLKGNATVLSAGTRFSITRAVSIARDIRDLEEIIGIKPKIKVTDFPDNPDYRHPEKGGVDALVHNVREALGKRGVISSMIRDVCDVFGILIFTVALEESSVDALSTYTPSSGPIIVVNENGENVKSVYGLRVAIAHELCHLLFDRSRMQEIASFCELERGNKKNSKWASHDYEIERRARAFQVEFIAPKKHLLRTWKKLGRPKSHVPLVHEYGLGATGVAWQLSNARKIKDYRRKSVQSPANVKWTEWRDLKVDGERGVPYMRTQNLLPLVREAILEDKISSSFGRSLLRTDVQTWDRLYCQWMSS